MKIITPFLLMVSLFTRHTCLANTDPVYDEITVFIAVPGLGSVEIPAVMYNEAPYLAVADLFNFLKIRNILSPGLDSVTGFFIDPQAGFLIDGRNNRIVYMDKVFDVKSTDIIRTEANLYLRAGYFGLVFGLECTFHFRSLSVSMATRLELPAIREMRLEAMRNNMRFLKGEIKADTSITGQYRSFHFGMADWSVITTQDTKGIANTRLNLAIGAIIAGGEANISLNYDGRGGFSQKQQYYLWRHVNNNNPVLRQVMAGKIIHQAISSVYAPVIGMQFTNTPTTFRRSFGSYVLSNHTNPNWMVELYVNNVLVNYVRADAAGFFSFEVPLVYGNSVIKLRFYGPWGEERTTEQNINIPFNFLPAKQLEYTVSAGVVEDSLHSRYARANFNYGMGKNLTIGAGVEYLSSVTTGKSMPFINASLRVARNMLLSAEYVQGVKIKSTLQYRTSSNLQFEIAGTRYARGQKAINNTYLEERRAVVSFPFHSKKASLFSRLSLYQVILPSSKYTTAEALFSGVAFGVNANITTYAVCNPGAKPYIYTNLSATFRLPAKLSVTPQAQYEYKGQKFIGVKGELARPVSRSGYVNVFYENNFKSRFTSIGVGFRYDLSFAQAGFSARRSSRSIITTTSARGSLVYDEATHYLGANNRTGVGKGGISILPYLDMNGNGRRDDGEPKAAGLKVQVNAGRIQYHNRDTAILISDLEAYAGYIVKLNTEGFDNITWQIKQPTLKITVNANQFAFIEVPVTVAGEASGMVFWEDGKGQKGQGRVLVNFYRSNGSLAGQAFTEADGYFNFAGLPPGAYTARIDPGQLQQLQAVSSPVSLPVTMAAGREGSMVGGLKFVVNELQGVVK